VIVSKPKKMPFSPHEWVPLKAALRRIMSIIESRDDALFYLNRDLRNGRLRSALVEISPDGKETRTLLNPSDWQQRTVKAALNPEEGVWVEPYVDGRWLGRGVDLDKWYPAATATMTAAPQSDDVQTPKPRRRKPGPKVKKDWRRHVAAEADRIMENKNRIPSAAELAQFCENKLGYQPDERAIQKLLRYLLSD
jgi:hypothetical protein